MFTYSEVTFVIVIMLVVGTSLGYAFKACDVNNSELNSTSSMIDIKTEEKVLVSNNILLKISLWKMIILFAPKDANGCYCIDKNGYMSDAFYRLGVEENTINEKMALEKIEILNKRLGEL